MEITHRTTILPGPMDGSGPDYLSLIEDMEVVTIGGQSYLYAGSRSTGGLTAFQLGEGVNASFLEELSAAPDRGTYGLVDLDTLEFGGETYLLPAGVSDDRVALHQLGNDGGFYAVAQIGNNPQTPGALALTEVVTMGSSTFVFTAQQGATQVGSFQVTTGGVFQHQFDIQDGASGHLDSLSASASATIGAKTFVFFASATDDSVSSHRMTNNGTLIEVDAANPASELWISTPSALIDVVAGGNTYLVVGSAGSDSLSELKVAGWGGLSVVDHVLDDLSTRFQDVTALDSVKTNHRNLVIAGGSDDGISLFELTPSGKLIHLDSIADELNTTLQNVSAIEAVVLGDELQIFATSESEEGVTQFTVDLSKFGVLRRGSSEGEYLNGIWADDLLEGFEGDDTLKGNNGADTLIDGAGKDKMFGGNGKDTFVFEPDRALDIVKDFKDGQDKLDLSKFEMLYRIDQLELIQKSYGVYIRYQGEGFRIEADSGTLDVDDLTDDDFIF